MDSIHVAQSPAKQSAYLNSFNTKNPDNAEKGAGGTSGESDTSCYAETREYLNRYLFKVIQSTT